MCKFCQELSEQCRLLLELCVNLLHFGSDILQVSLHVLPFAADVHRDLMNMSELVVQLVIGIVLELSVRIQITSDCLELAFCMLHPGLYGHQRLFDILRIIIRCGHCCLVGLHGFSN